MGDKLTLGIIYTEELKEYDFGPQIIIRNGGSDPHFSDGLTNLGMTVKGFRMIGEKVRCCAGGD